MGARQTPKAPWITFVPKIRETFGWAFSEEILPTRNNSI